MRRIAEVRKGEREEVWRRGEIYVKAKRKMRVCVCGWESLACVGAYVSECESVRVKQREFE